MFSIEAGSLAPNFGDNGGFATIGIVFQVPFDFNNSFAAMANTKIYPTSIPDATTLVLLGNAMLIGSLFGRKKAF